MHMGAMTGNKNVFELLAAFVPVYLNPKTKKNVYLILKGLSELYPWLKNVRVMMASIFKGFPDSVGRDEKSWNEFNRHILLVNGSMGVDSINALYSAVDCYVSVYKGEGFNLPVLEALSTGLTCIVPDKGPTEDFSDSKLSLKVPCKIVNPDMSNQSILVADHDKFVEKMMEAYINRPSYPERQAPDTILRDFSQISVASRYLDWFKNLRHQK